MNKNIIAATIFLCVAQADAFSAVPAGAQALIDTYPDCITGFDNGDIVFADGSRMEYDDMIPKSFTDMLDHSDIEDMFKTRYSVEGKPAYIADPGRSRCEALFRKMYGSNEKEVRKNLVTVDWFGQKVRFTSVNGAAEQLRKVAHELSHHPELRKYLRSSGAFYWRKVRGAPRLSAHSYGIAFDIAVPHADYWRWSHPKASETDSITYRNRIPAEIVRIFERHGFIWGGAWYHYDTMHFEYRPELLRHAKLTETAEPVTNPAA